MHVSVNGVRLFFDVEGTKFAPEGPTCEPSQSCATSSNGQSETGAPRAPEIQAGLREAYELAFSTVTARRFCDQQEMSLQTATGRSLP
jgi:hypothetical protein